MKVWETMKKQISLLLIICFCLFGTPVMVFASVPQVMSYHGLLKDGQGNYLTGTYSMTFRIYSAVTGGTALWTETQPSVSASSGKFNVELGSVTALNLPFNTQYWLSIQVGNDSEMTPRIKLTSVGYSYLSEEVVNSFTESAHDSKSHLDVEGVRANATNVAKTNFKLDAYSAASANNMGNMIVDVFHDESGIDTNSSSDYIWNGSPNYDVIAEPLGGIDGNASLVLHANGTDGSTTFTDSSSAANTITATGGAQIDTAQKKFGTASGLFDGSNDYLSIPDNNAWDFGTGDFTIDFWVRFNSTSGNQDLIDLGQQANNNSIIVNSSNGVIYGHITGAGGGNIGGGSAVSAGTWAHIAFVRSSGTCKIYVNGTSVASGTLTTAVTPSGNTEIGRATFGGQYFNGWLDEVRVSNIARWTANFTPPSCEYAVPSSSSATVISTAFTETAAPVEAMVIGDETLNDGTVTYYISRDNGTTWSEADNGEVVSLTSQPSGTQVRWKAVITDDAELNGIAVALT